MSGEQGKLPSSPWLDKKATKKAEVSALSEGESREEK
jgi:hypothetical protein